MSFQDGEPTGEPLDTDFALKAAGLGAWELDPKTNQLTCDKRSRTLAGFSVDNLLPIPYEQLIHHIHPDDIERVKNAVKWAMNPKSEGYFDVTCRVVGADRRLLHWVRFMGRSYVNEAGEVYRFAGVVQDVDRQVQEQEKTVLSQQLCALAIEGAGAGAFYVRLRDNHIDYDHGLSKLLTGQQNETLTWDDLINFIHPADRPIRQQAYEDGLLTGRIQYEVRFIWTDGSVHWIRIIGTYMFNEAGQAQGLRGILLDVTEEVRLKQLVKESQQRLLNYFEQSPVAIAIISKADLTFEMANSFYGVLVGRTPDQLVGKSLLEALPELRGQGFDTLLKNVLDTGEPFMASEMAVDIVRHNQREIIYVNMSYQPHAEVDTTISGVLVVAIDVTAQVLARKVIEETEADLRNAVELAELGTWQIDLTTGLIDYSQRLRVWHGLTPNELVNSEQAFRIVRQADWPRVREAITHARTPGSTGLYDLEYTVEATPVSRERILHAQGKAYFNEQGQAYKISGMVQDVTQQRKVQLALEQQVQERTEQLAATNGELEAINEELATASENVAKTNERLEKSNLHLSQTNQRLQQLALLVENAPEYMAILDLQGRIQFMNQYGLTLLGINWETAEHKLITDFLPSDDFSQFDQEILPGLLSETGQWVGIINIWQSKEDTLIPVAIQGFAMHDSTTGQPYALVTIGRDLRPELAARQALVQSEAQYKQLATELETRVADLRRSNQSLEQFAYVASHDLQEPLRKIQQFGGLLQSQYADQLGEGIDYFQRMQAAASRMSLLIKDLLSFSRISTTQARKAPVSLTRVVADVLDNLSVSISETNAQIQIDPLPTVQGDALQLGQLFQNLISNAIKFSGKDQSGKSGTPQITIRAANVTQADLPPTVKPIETAEVYHRIDVSDNGIGFDEKYIDRIFQVFQRLHGKNEFAGTGIGLAICERVAANHRGAITASSKPGQGATFSIFLPV